MESIVAGKRISMDWIRNLQFKDNVGTGEDEYRLKSIGIEKLSLILMEDYRKKNIPPRSSEYFDKPLEKPFTFEMAILDRDGKKSLILLLGSKLKVCTSYDILDLAIAFERTEIVRQIMTHVPEWALQHHPESMTVFHLAAAVGNLEILDILFSLLPKGYHWILKPKFNRMTFCELAISYNYVDIANYCFEKKIISKFDYSDFGHGNMFHLAAVCWSVDVFESMRGGISVQDMGLSAYQGTIYHSFAFGKYQEKEGNECSVLKSCDLPHHHIDIEDYLKNIQDSSVDMYQRTFRDILNAKNTENLSKAKYYSLLHQYEIQNNIPSKYFLQPDITYLVTNQIDGIGLIERLIKDGNWKDLHQLFLALPNALYSRTRKGKSILQIAEENFIPWLFKALVRMYKTHKVSISQEADLSGSTIIRQLIQKENIKGLSILLEESVPEFYEPDFNGLYPIEFAVQASKVKSIEFLLSALAASQKLSSLYNLSWNAGPLRNLLFSSEIFNVLIPIFLKYDTTFLFIPNLFVVGEGRYDISLEFFERHYPEVMLKYRIFNILSKTRGQIALDQIRQGQAITFRIPENGLPISLDDQAVIVSDDLSAQIEKPKAKKKNKKKAKKVEKQPEPVDSNTPFDEVTSPTEIQSEPNIKETNSSNVINATNSKTESIDSSAEIISPTEIQSEPKQEADSSNVVDVANSKAEAVDSSTPTNVIISSTEIQSEANIKEAEATSSNAMNTDNSKTISKSKGGKKKNKKTIDTESTKKIPVPKLEKNSKEGKKRAAKKDDERTVKVVQEAQANEQRPNAYADVEITIPEEIKESSKSIDEDIAQDNEPEKATKPDLHLNCVVYREDLKRGFTLQQMLELKSQNEMLGKYAESVC